MTLSLPSVLAVAAAMSFLIAAFYVALARASGPRSPAGFSFPWLALAFGAYGVRAACQILPGTPLALGLVSALAYVGWSFGLWRGVAVVGRARPPPRWVGAVPAGLAAWIVVAHLAEVGHPWRALPQHAAGAALFVHAGVHLVRRARTPGVGWDSTALAVLLWLGALSTAAYPFARPTALAPWGFALSALIALPVGVGIIVTSFRRDHVALRAEIEARRATDRALRGSEQALREETGKLHLVLDSMAEAVFFCDATADVVDLNRAGEALFGVRRDEPPPAGFGVRWGLATPEGALIPGAETPLLRAVRGERVERADLLVKRADGATRRVVVTARPLLDAERRVVGAVAVVDDVTDRVRLEERLREARKLDAVARLAGGVAHDFNNLLTAILGTSELILDRLEPDDVLRDPTAEIREAARKAAVLTRQLLTFSRRQLVQPVVLDLGELLAATGPMLRRLAGPAVEVALAPPASPTLVRIDRGQLVQVLVTLAENARDAMPRGGRLAVGAATAEVSPEEARLRPGLAAGRHAIVTLSDTGTGMSAAVKEHLFEPFFTTKEGGTGTGLGLSTVHGIVTQAGGHVAVESEPGAGTRFALYLPLVAEDADRAVARSPAGRAATGTETLLLVEDEALVRRLAARVLRGAGYTVLEAADGEEAMRILASDAAAPIAAIVTDVVMPRMGGEDLADRIARDRPGTPVLFMSGYTDHRAEFQRRIDEGAALLQKPFTPEALTRAVRELLDRRGQGGAPAR